MRRTITTITAISAALALAACNEDTADDTATGATTPVVETTDTDATTAGAGTDTATETEDAAGQTGDAAGQTGDAAGQTGDAAGPVCADFFETQGTPLADRAGDQYDVVGSGDDLDPVSFSEVSLLESRIGELVEEADGEHADLLERINAPFTEVVQAVVSENTGNDPEIPIPEVDTTDAEDALAEFEETCAS